MGQKRTTYSNHLDALKDELHKLLRHYAAWKRMSKFENINNINRIEFCDILIALTCIENDLIVRLSKLTDSRSGVHSLVRIKLEIPNDIDNRVFINEKIDECCGIINLFKNKIRYVTLGHLKIGYRDDRYIPKFDFSKEIGVLVDLIDLLNKEKINYTWKDGSQEKYDLRDFINKVLYTFKFSFPEQRFPNWYIR